MSTKPIKTVLISQHAPDDISKSQYKQLLENHGLSLTFHKFFDVVGISIKEFRSFRIVHTDYVGVIFTSRFAVDNYFRLAKEMRLKIPEDMKYFCLSENLANYLQNYIQFRKRKIFFGKATFMDLALLLQKYKVPNLLFPCAEEVTNDNFKILDKARIKYTKAVMYRSEIKDLTPIDIQRFDLVVLFSPMGVKALTTSFPDKSALNGISFSAFGETAQQSLKDAGIMVSIPAPTPTCPSVVMAISEYLNKSLEEKEAHLKEMEEAFLRKTPKKKILGLDKKPAKRSKSTKTVVKRTRVLKNTPSEETPPQ